MHRHQLEHLIRASAGITGASEFVIIGSQAVLGQFPQAPEELLVSIEADAFTLRGPADADLIDGSIGEGSPFHRTFGCYAHGVSRETPILPADWQARLVPGRNENTGGGTGLCLEVHDRRFRNWRPDVKKTSNSSRAVAPSTRAGADPADPFSRHQTDPGSSPVLQGSARPAGH